MAKLNLRWAYILPCYAELQVLELQSGFGEVCLWKQRSGQDQPLPLDVNIGE